MKRNVLGVVAGVLLLSGVAVAQYRTFTGEIMDSQCAKTGSHATTLKGKDPNGVSNKKMCTQECVKMGGKYVLYDSTSKTVYQLDDQQKSANFAGQEVKVTGSYDQATKTIHNYSLQSGNRLTLNAN